MLESFPAVDQFAQYKDENVEAGFQVRVRRENNDEYSSFFQRNGFVLDRVIYHSCISVPAAK